MPTKTDRILSYLPGTFRAQPRPSALYALADAFGDELQAAENSLAALMSAHWVDHADRGAETIDDLARLAALYGLAPRVDESVEEFREHLKRYIRTFLEGTVTVQGILRVTAEVLALRIDDDHVDIDAWWSRSDDTLVTHEPRADGAAARVLGIASATARGAPELAGRVTGTVDLSGAVDLLHTGTLRLDIDGAGPIDIDLAAAAMNPAAASLDELVSAINDGLGTTVARHDRRFLTLEAPSSGPSSRVDVLDTAADAAPRILGLAPRRYTGRDATAATITGTQSLAAGVDLSDVRFLRLVIDGSTVAEIDCAGADPAHTTLDEVRDAINAGVGMAVASHDGVFLTLQSPAVGGVGSIAFRQPAAQEATGRLFGPVSSTYTGRDAQAARVTGTVDLGDSADLSQQSSIELTIDAGVALTINCAGADPGATTLDEVVATVNAAAGADIASHDGRFLTLTSPSTGAASAIVLGDPGDVDAAERLFGISARRFPGSAARRALLRGQADLSSGVDLMGQYSLAIAVDGGPPTVVDLRTAAADPRAATLAEVVAAINAAVPEHIASHDGQVLVLSSPSVGGPSQLVVGEMVRASERRFVSRARIIDEAAQAVFGFVHREARGSQGSAARIRGSTDLSRGVDLRATPYLRLGIDGKSPVDIDCRGPRPRATLAGEIVDAINSALGAPVASHDGKSITLTSPSHDETGRIVIEPPRNECALERLLDVVPDTYRGSEATGVVFVATVDLEGGVDLSAAGSVKLGYDDVAPVEIDCSGADPAETSLSEIVIAINVALSAVIASHDGSRLRLASPTAGASARIVFETPSAPDATATLFGISVPRSYHGHDATAGRIRGQRDLVGPIDLAVRRYLRLAVNGGSMMNIDCAAAAADPGQATLEEVVTAINEALGDTVASRQDDRLVLSSTTVGTASRIAIEHYTAGDARPAILGEVADEATASPPAPAVIEGEVSLGSPVDLHDRRLLRLSVDGRQLPDIDVSGALPRMTFATEVVEAINRHLPGLAALGEANQLRLTSPSAGEDSHLAVLPLRYLEVVEYPPQPAQQPVGPVHHGRAWQVANAGAADAEADIRLSASQGVVWPALINERTGWQLRLLTVLQPGQAISVRGCERRGLAAWVHGDDGTFPLQAERILAAPLGAQIMLPQPEPTRLSRDANGQPAAHLIDPLSPRVVTLRARTEMAGHVITVAVSEGVPKTMPPPPPGCGVATLQGLLRHDAEGLVLDSVSGDPIARLRQGPDVRLMDYLDTAIAVSGAWYPDTGPLMIVSSVAHIFDVTLVAQAPGGEIREEQYPGVSIGADPQRDDDLVRRTSAGAQRSTLVKAAALAKTTARTLPRGISQWRYGDCHGDRFDEDCLDDARFSGGGCRDRAVFDISRFTPGPPERVSTVFADALDPPQASGDVDFTWTEHRPGAMEVNLPADLPARFGGRFDDARFGQAAGEPELYARTVTEPPEDGQFLVTRLNDDSTLVEASVVGFVPQGWRAVTMPFRKPAALTLGNTSASARLYLDEEGLDGFIEIRARSAGAWGNAITVSARESGPAMFDVEVVMGGARFENARKAVLGKDLADQDLYLPSQIQTLLQAGPIGVLQAKAAGIRVRVTRDRTETDPADDNSR